MKNYVICAVPRSGSNYLCELLSSLGYAGRPAEHLWDPPGTAPPPLSERWPRLLRAGRGENGVFGIKLMWYQAERLATDLPSLVGLPGKPLARVLAATLDEPAYVYLTRRDHLRQAISFVRAMQTDQWRSVDGNGATSYYDEEAIARAMAWLEQEEANWEGFFARSDLQPYRLTYEELDTDPEAALTDLVHYLGHSGQTLLRSPHSSLERQADAETEAWVQRFSTEARR